MFLQRDFTGKIDRLCLPICNFIQVTGGTVADLQQDLELTGERDCGGQGGGVGSKKFPAGMSGLLKKKHLRLYYCIVIMYVQ